LNVEGYWNGLLSFLDHAAQEAFVRPENRELVLVADTAEEMLDRLEQWRAPQHVEKWIDSGKR
jgi:predicted Rossmann-fold nucleotide-binding protein